MPAAPNRTFGEGVGLVWGSMDTFDPDDYAQALEYDAQCTPLTSATT